MPPDAATTWLRRCRRPTLASGLIVAALGALLGPLVVTREVSFGPVVITINRPPTAAAVADCPAEWFCFYAGVDYTHLYGKLSSCGYQSLADYGWANRIDSVYYGMQNGKVTFYNDGVVDTALFTLSTALRGDADVSPYRDTADYVYRTC